ncbi:MAG: cupin domain-containing protein [bacterium]
MSGHEDRTKKGGPAATPGLPSFGSLFAGIAAELPEEQVDVLARSGGVRIERIVSRGHASPEGFWYDQPEDEWVLVAAGEGTLEFEDGRRITLRPGDWVDIPAGVRHRVARTAEDRDTVWVAVWREAATSVSTAGKGSGTLPG